MPIIPSLTAQRARHLENCLLHFDSARLEQVNLPLDLFLRRYFKAHKHLKPPDRTFVVEHSYELVRWRALLDLVGGKPYGWATRLRTYFVSERWRAQTANPKVQNFLRSSFPPELFARLEKSLGSSTLAKDVADTSNEKPVYFLRCNTLVQDREKICLVQIEGIIYLCGGRNS